MLKNNWLLEIAVDGDGAEQLSGESVDTSTTDSTETQTEENGAGENSEPQYFDIDGEKLTLEDIKEYRKGYLRQSDYTRKTQELSSLKQQASEAMALFEYLQENPDIAEKLADYADSPDRRQTAQKLADPALRQIEEVQLKLKSLEVDKELELIKAKDKDVDELELLKLATELRVPIQEAYHTWRGKNIDKIIEKRLSEQSKSITDNIKKNGVITKTLISEGDKNLNNANYGLSKSELDFADKIGMSAEEYAKWKA